MTITPPVPPPAEPSGPLSGRRAFRGAAPAPWRAIPDPGRRRRAADPGADPALGVTAVLDIDTYRQLDGYQALPAALAVDPAGSPS